MPPLKKPDPEAIFACFTREALLIRIRSGHITWEERQGFQSRNANVLELLHRTQRIHPLPDTTFVVFTGDVRHPHEPQDDCVFTFARNALQKNPLLPNFNFIHHKECGIGDYFSEVQPRLFDLAKSKPWEDRHDQVFFIGAATNPIRKKLVRAANGHPHFDLRLMDWGPQTAPVAIEDHVNWRYLLNMNGWGYSGRLNLLLPLGSCVIQLRDRRPSQQFQEYFWDFLKPGRHLLVVPYSRWEPGWLIRRRILATLAKHDPAAIGRAGVEWCRQHFSEAAILASTYRSIQSFVACQ